METIIRAFFLDDLRDEVKNERRMYSESFTVTDAAVQERSFS